MVKRVYFAIVDNGVSAEIATSCFANNCFFVMGQPAALLLCSDRGKSVDNMANNSVTRTHATNTWRRCEKIGLYFRARHTVV